MNAITRDVKSGRVKLIVYTKTDLNKSVMIRSVLKDLIRNVPDFTTKVAWILKVIPDKDHTIKDVLNDYVKENVGLKTLFFAQAGTLSTIPASDYTDKKTSCKVITDEFNTLIDCGFNGIIWNRCMSKSYGNINICLYMNDGGKSFVEKYMSKDSIISRTISTPINIIPIPEST